MLDLDLLRTFLAVLDRGSFTRAAQGLNRTQSAVSMQVGRLEARVGAPLLVRRRDRVSATPEGEALAGYARRMLGLHDEALGQIARHRIEGHVRLGVMEDYGTVVLPAVLAAYARQAPAVRLDMETGLTRPMLNRLGRDFDLVVAMHDADEQGGRLLRRERAVWAASPDLAVLRQRPVAVALNGEGCLFRAWAMQALAAADLEWRLAFVSQSLAGIASLARQGLAVTVVKQGILPPGLRPVPAGCGLPPLPEADIRLHRAPVLTPAARHLAEHIEAGLGAAAPATAALA
ncbi:LysR family transcriptional regulator [Marinivivus vitaminiproducens]|uniref:LysR family transcriptional regulator n=1 Tax=Marinivivus vitaminiproducens TaxID=3035935 RepID=UPI00279DCE68|nr:LysR family transcriptional regulator [Geminicoccaceae bacterium SCSIO 64248]